MSLAHVAPIHALRRLTDKVRAAAGVSSDDSPFSRLLVEHSEATLAALGQASRRAWLSLEIALGGSALWEKLAAGFADVQGNHLRQQMDVFLDTLNLAGLGNDDFAPARFADEIRRARQAGVLDIAIPDTEDGEPIFLNTVTESGESATHAVTQLGQELEQAGYASVARLLALRTLWGDSLFLSIIEYFLARDLHNRPELELDLADDAVDDTWRCLDRLARLFDKHETAVVALLERPEEGSPRVERNDAAVEQLYQLGLRRYQHGDYQQAAAHFTAALKLDPSNVRVYGQRGEAYRLQCEYERAIADFNIALRLGGKSSTILVSRAIAYHVSGEQQRAVNDCTAALELEPNHATAFRTRAAARAELGNHDLALSDLTEAIARTPEDAEAHYLRGVIRARKRDFAQAIADFGHTLALNSYHVQAYLQRGHAHRCLGDHAQAIRDYTEALKHHPGNVIALSGRGLAYKLKGEPDRAIADFSAALRLEPENGQIFFHRGALYRAKGDFARAQADLDEAIRRQPENWAALYHRAKIALAQGQFALALLDLTEVVHLNPNLMVGFLSRALASDRLGQQQKALEDTTHALKLDANSPAAHLVRGVVYAHTGEYAAAIGNLTQAIRLDERFALAYHERCLAYTLQKEHERALADANKLIALEPRNAQAYAQRSIIHHFMGEVQLALSDYSQALQIDPASMMTGWNAGLAESARGQTTQRIADYIDGVRPETSAGEAPPAPEFQIVVKPAGALAPELETPPRSDESAAPPALRSPARQAQETSVMPALADDTTETSPPKPRPQAKPRRPAPTANGKPSPATRKAPAPEPPAPEAAEESVEKTSNDDVVLEVSPEFEGTENAEKEAEENAEEFAIQQLLAEEPAAPPPPAPKPTPAPESSRLRKAYAAAIEASASVPVEEDVPAATRPSITPPPATKPTPPKPKLKKYDDDDEPTLLQRWKKPIPIGVTIAASLLLLYMMAPLFRSSNRVRVFPAQGKAECDGQPIANASIFLHPTWVKEPNFPRPRATVNDDGTFALGTYAREDGAPPGEYKVTVQWFTKTDPADEDRLPVNLLPPRYAKAETTDVTVEIREGENQLPAIKLKY